MPNPSIKLSTDFRGSLLAHAATPVQLTTLEGQHLESDGAGVFLFAPFVAQLRLDEVVRAANLPESKSISALSYFLSLF